jgi:hypothetical protein
VNDLRSIGSSACVTSSGPTTFVLKTSSMSAAHLLQARRLRETAEDEDVGDGSGKGTQAVPTQCLR